jgi:hypothetical protein
MIPLSLAIDHLYIFHFTDSRKKQLNRFINFTDIFKTMKNLTLLSILMSVLSCSSPSEKNTLKFTKETYSGEWPFSVNEIEVYCSGYTEIYGRTNDGKIYALNGSAKGASRNDTSISKVEEIWLDDPKWAGLKISYGDFITQGLVLCENK